VGIRAQRDRLVRQLRADEPGCYFRSCLAITTRWIWLVPS